MIIPLSDDWQVKVVPLNFVLEQRYRTKPSNEHPEGRLDWKVCGYYSGLQAALLALPDHLAQSPEIETYEGFLAEWEALSKRITARIGR